MATPCVPAPEADTGAAMEACCPVPLRRGAAAAGSSIRRSKRRATLLQGTRRSARKRARVHSDGAKWGDDFGILPSD